MAIIWASPSGPKGPQKTCPVVAIGPEDCQKGPGVEEDHPAEGKGSHPEEVGGEEEVA